MAALERRDTDAKFESARRSTTETSGFIRGLEQINP